MSTKLEASVQVKNISWAEDLGRVWNISNGLRRCSRAQAIVMY